MDSNTLVSGNGLAGPNGSSRLENFLRLNRASKKILYREVPKILREQDQSNYAGLDQSAPGTSSLYAGYSTLFHASSRARFVSGIAKEIRPADVFGAQRRLSVVA